MAVSRLVRRRSARRVALRLLLDGRRVKQRRDDRRRADPDRDARLHQFGSPFFVALLGIAHSVLSFGCGARPYAQQRRLEREVPCIAG